MLELLQEAAGLLAFMGHNVLVALMIAALMLGGYFAVWGVIKVAAYTYRLSDKVEGHPILERLYGIAVALLILFLMAAIAGL